MTQNHITPEQAEARAEQAEALTMAVDKLAIWVGMADTHPELAKRAQDVLDAYRKRREAGMHWMENAALLAGDTHALAGEHGLHSDKE